MSPVVKLQQGFPNSRQPTRQNTHANRSNRVEILEEMPEKRATSKEIMERVEDLERNP